jgi:hypothetical protein
MRPQGEPDPHPGAGPGHEVSDVSIRGIFIFAIGLIGLGLVVQFALAAAMQGYRHRERRAEAQQPPQFVDERGQFPAPNLQGSPPAELQTQRAGEAARLSEYGWADRKGGIARIPIDRAMDLLAQKGLPVHDGRAGAQSKSADKPTEPKPVDAGPSAPTRPKSDRDAHEK